MSDDFYSEIEEVIGKHRAKDAAEQKDKETEERFKRLEARFDELGNLISERIPEKSPAAGNSEPSAGEPGEEKPSGNEADPPPPDPEVNVERVTHFSVPRIYNGDDEPDIVTYIDADDGETKTRKGRRKNYPTQTNVEFVMPEPAEGRPQEPEANAQ